MIAESTASSSGIGRQHHDARPRQLRSDLAAGLDARPVRQADVHDDDVGLELASLLDGLGDRPGLGDDLEALAPTQERDQALPDDLVVVDDQQAQGPGGVGAAVLPSRGCLRGAERAAAR